MKKRKQKLVYRPVGFALGTLGGLIASTAFKKAWKAISDEDDAPDPGDEDRKLGEILLAAAIQGVIFSVVRAAVDRGGAVAVRRLTGTWPG
ncbi:DUF4235 domain-containing protein [Streptomyces chitinivorans]|uniref:DUF4235 domain-containing protein n=1 Tax=Streptomyces chitinivorans TaxID=1257027 RepID=A0ABW7HS62_9ACTN|nr:DUF4235 domain-containing protein [Streptomyces chitinivorans]MDH2411635.1 DUF4235 domain-containing protein [Streptomyces chitinivorans]